MCRNVQFVVMSLFILSDSNVRSTSYFSSIRGNIVIGKSPAASQKHRSRNLLSLRGGGYDFYGKDSRQLGPSENFTALSRIPAWDSSDIIAKPDGHNDWLRITAHQKEVTAMIVITFEGHEYLISADNFGIMLVWDTQSWECVRELYGHR